MENICQFDLNASLRLWLAKIAQSPHFQNENVAEMESHVRDSVTRLQSQGLSEEESFLIAIRRVGSVAKLELEFAKVNKNRLNLVAHGLVLAFFSIGCWFLWALLHFPHMVWAASRGAIVMPAFTVLVLGFRPYLIIPPLLAVGYCAYVWFWKSKGRSSWMGFFATTMAVLVLLTLQTLIAVLLPVIAFMHSQPVAG